MLISIILAEMTVFQGVSVIVPAVVTIGIALASLIITTSRKNREKIDTLALDVALLKQQISPFWASLQAKIADALHHPGEEHKVLDGLLEKLQALTLTVEEKLILKETLENLAANAPTDAAQKAKMLLALIPMVEAEAAGKFPATDLRTMEQKLEAERVNGGTPA